MKSRPDRASREDASRVLVRRPLLQFVARTLVATVLVAAATVAVAQQIAREESLDGARVRGESFAVGVAAPLVTPGVRRGERRAVARFETVMRSRLRTGSIAHMKLWDVDGTVLWSDESGLVGRRFTFPAPVRRATGHTFVYAELSSHERPDEAAERDAGDLYEVYAGARDATGRPLVFETYWPPRTLHVEQRHLLWTIAPVSLVALLLLLLAVVPLAFSLASRLGRALDERGRLLRRSQAAADVERRRLAQTLHDGVIQDLAGLAYGLRSLARRVERGRGSEDLVASLDAATATLKRDLQSLRSILTETYPPSLEGDGLRPALQRLADRAAADGVLVDVQVDDAPLPLTVAQTAYRVVREGLLNVVRHADADHAWVRVVAEHRAVSVEVSDDGTGGEPAIPEVDSGHLGLRLLHDGLVDLGGQLDLGPRPGGGSLLRARLPLHAEAARTPLPTR
jgi:two-component system, NarL family, sensor kinase